MQLRRPAGPSLFSFAGLILVSTPDHIEGQVPAYFVDSLRRKVLPLYSFIYSEPWP